MAFMSLQFAFMGDLPVSLRWAVALLLVFTFVLVTKTAFQRLSLVSGAHRIGVITANAGVFICVMLLVSDLSFKSNSIKQAILITSGQHDTAETLAALNDEISNDSLLVFVLQDVVKNAKEIDGKFQLPRSWRVIKQPEQIFAELDSLQQLEIKGDGLTQTQWHVLQDLAQMHFQHPLSIVFTPPPAVLGLVDMSWRRRLAVGEIQEITGQLQLPEGQSDIYELALISPAGETLSQQRLADTNTFSFQFMTQMAGPQRYFLELVDTRLKQVVRNESVTFDNYVSVPPNILIRQSSPSFETRHIKNWAAKFGSPVTVATQISQSTFISQHVNIDRENLANTADLQSASDWQNYDVVIMDGRALMSLTEQQSQSLYESIQAGLGMLVMADESLLSEVGGARVAPWIDIRLVALTDKTQNDQTRIFGHKFISQLPIPTYPTEIRSIPKGSKLNTLFRDKDDQPVVVSQTIGQGNIAISLINSSYQWKLSSHMPDFSRYWQTLLHALAKPASGPYWLAPTNTVLMSDMQGATICAVLNKEAEHISLYQSPESAEVPMTLSQDKINNTKYCGRFWPVDSGWYRFQLTQGALSDALYWHHDAKRHWAAWRQANKHHASTQQTAVQRNSVSSPQWVAVTKLPIWAIFVLLSTLLWVERKFYASASPNSKQ